ALKRAGFRHLVLHLPSFRLERCGYGSDEVAVIIAEQRSALRLVALTEGARTQGLAEGMTVTEARARLPEVAVEVWDPEGEAADRHALLEAFRALSDRVATLWQDHLVVEASATARLFGGERGLL